MVGSRALASLLLIGAVGACWGDDSPAEDASEMVYDDAGPTDAREGIPDATDAPWADAAASSPDASEPDAAPSCVADNEPCAGDDDCCSYYCASDGYCGLPVSCSASGDPCIYDSDCCAYYCDESGTCY